MESNKAIIDLEEYEKLKKMERELKNGKHLVISEFVSAYNGYAYSEAYYTTEEIVETLVAKNEELRKTILEKTTLINDKDVLIGKIKQMNYFKFKKWKTSV